MGHGVWVPAFAGTTVSLLQRLRPTLLQAALGAAPQPARTRAGGGPGTLRHHARDDGSVIAIDLLQQAAAADRKVVMNFRRMQMKPVVIDDVDVGLVAGRDNAAIVQTERKRGPARLERHHEGDREFFAPLAAAGPGLQQLGWEAAI